MAHILSWLIGNLFKRTGIHLFMQKPVRPDPASMATGFYSYIQVNVPLIPSWFIILERKEKTSFAEVLSHIITGKHIQ